MDELPEQAVDNLNETALAAVKKKGMSMAKKQPSRVGFFTVLMTIQFKKGDKSHYRENTSERMTDALQLFQAKHTPCVTNNVKRW